MAFFGKGPHAIGFNANISIPTLLIVAWPFFSPRMWTFTNRNEKWMHTSLSVESESLAYIRELVSRWSDMQRQGELCRVVLRLTSSLEPISRVPTKTRFTVDEFLLPSISHKPFDDWRDPLKTSSIGDRVHRPVQRPLALDRYGLFRQSWSVVHVASGSESLSTHCVRLWSVSMKFVMMKIALFSDGGTM